MQEGGPRAVLLSEYRPFPYEVEQVALRFRLDGAATRVRSRITFRRRSDPADLVLNGHDLTLLWAQLDGAALDLAQCERRGGDLVLPAWMLPQGRFVWECETQISPATNTALEGLFLSRGMFCTQCEPESFRRITYYPDRPDVTAPFRVRIEADAPVLLSNGNLIDRGPGFAVWDDPLPKPAYLFALVAGDLSRRSASFVTASGRRVELNVWVRPGPDEERCLHALASLQSAMAWDERVYGREYDLDVYNIVAVDDFNIGAMENKGLNIFNSKYVLASPETATDRDYELIEATIAHEYFHNWTGNRISPRNWFQIALKEGLTVFREQQYVAATRSAPVKRIGDAMMLRARQFREDSGPLAHPVRPESYIAVANFYTSTVYEKGGEVVRMLHLLVGDAAYRAALELYFARHDGEGVTIEDWLAIFEEVTGRDLSQFKLWYTQSGTPRLDVSESWADGVLTLHLRQWTPPDPHQRYKRPLVIPVAVGLIDPGGREVVPTTVLEMTKGEQEFRFEGLARRPVVSLLRDFSAPVIVERATGVAERAFCLAHDSDPFARWEAGRLLARDLLEGMVRDGARPGRTYVDAVGRMLDDSTLDPAFRAMTLMLPGEDDIAQALFDMGEVPEPLHVYHLRRRLQTALAEELEPTLARLFVTMAVPGPYTPGPEHAARRALRLAALTLLSKLDDGRRARDLFDVADNMTEQFGALSTLMALGRGEQRLQAFYDRWAHDHLVIDKWFALQAMHAPPDQAVETVDGLTRHEDFEWRNPNRFRALLGAFASNAAGFHHGSGEGYELMASWLLRLDPVNPQTTARMLTNFETWRRYNPERQAQMTGVLKRILASENLSRDTFEMVTRILSQ